MVVIRKNKNRSAKQNDFYFFLALFIYSYTAQALNSGRA